MMNNANTIFARSRRMLSIDGRHMSSRRIVFAGDMRASFALGGNGNDAS